MSVERCRTVVRAWPEEKKVRVREVCVLLDRLTAQRSQVEYVRVNADYAFVADRCFDKRRRMIDVSEIRSLVEETP